MSNMYIVPCLLSFSCSSDRKNNQFGSTCCYSQKRQTFWTWIPKFDNTKKEIDAIHEATRYRGVSKSCNEIRYNERSLANSIGWSWTMPLETAWDVFLEAWRQKVQYSEQTRWSRCSEEHKLLLNLWLSQLLYTDSKTRYYY